MLYAQTTVKGYVVDAEGQPIPQVSIQILETTEGTVSDFDGHFTIDTRSPLPFKISISSIGFVSKKHTVLSFETLKIVLEEETTNLSEIVVSASRTPERIFESPVTVERFGLKEIKNTSSVDFYDGLENLKGITINTNSLTFKSINTRGFSNFGNSRFVQLIDGMDNAAPVLNFPLGNLLGITEIDVQSVELLPGASSALYGANAFNGILFMQSKNPFNFEGVSSYVKTGMTSQEAAGDNIFWDVGVRVAKKFSEKFAAKANFSYLEGTDWYATSEENLSTPLTGREDPNYDGLNVYGDEVSQNLRGIGRILSQTINPTTGQPFLHPDAVPLLPDENISRTGYLESNLTNYEAESVKFDGALHYRPFADDFEIVYQAKIGTGATIYQGVNRYSIKNFFLQQHKLEFKNNHFFIRGYMTDESAGDSYDMRFAGININRYWKDDATWFGEYVGAYAQTILSGRTEEEAHSIARQLADTGRLLPGTSEFKEAFDKVISNPDLTQGAQFKDASQLFHIDANYNLSHLQNFVDVQLGGSFRRYLLNSSGTIYTDYDNAIGYNEIGIYTQIQKQFLEDRLKLTGSMRYDKSELFEGQLTPRVSVGYTMGENNNHNLRGSIQTAFRNPTTQDLFIGLDTGAATLIGSAEENLDRYVKTFPVSRPDVTNGNETVTITGRAAYENSFSVSSVQAGTPESSNVDLVSPEHALVFEIGYRGDFKVFSIDLSTYYTDYEDFIATENVIVPLYGEVGDNSLSLLALQSGDFKVFQTFTNAKSGVQSYGAAVAVSAKVLNGFNLNANYTYADFEQDDPDFRAGFNTPNHTAKFSLSHSSLIDRLGFNISYRWSDTFYWQSGFADGTISSINVVDAQLNYTLPQLKSVFKIGAANIGGNEYKRAYGTGLIGTQYFISWTINNL